jgi:N-acetylglutamate synthase-like GNAT family acetyltransferase
MILTGTDQPRTSAQAISVRPFEVRDQVKARSLVLSGLGEHFEFIDESLNPDLDDIDANYTSLGHLFIVAEHEGSIVGTAGLLFGASGVARIVRMSAHKDMRRKGVGTALLDALIEAIRSRSIDSIHAHTEPHWTGSMAFYHRAGFEQIGRDEIDVHLRLVLSPQDAATRDAQT